jgi:dTDP-4-dehydrorhamnose reductase
MINVLVTGAKGQLGSELKEIQSLNNQVNFIFTDLDDLDITNFDEIKKFFSLKNIGFIINCAAYTAVDKAEEEFQKARLINVYGVSNLAEMSELYKIPIIHISTDYVFNGQTNVPIQEEFHENPQSVYGKTKYDGEEILAATTSNYIILRTSWLYSPYGNNFVKTMLKYGKEKQELKVVYDQVGSPTYAADLAQVIILILSDYIQNGKIKKGIYHYSNEGVCSWYDFAIEIFEIAKINCKVEPILTKDYPTPALRPAYSVLDKEKIKKTFNISIPHWKKSLEKCIQKIFPE